MLVVLIFCLSFSGRRRCHRIGDPMLRRMVTVILTGIGGRIAGRRPAAQWRTMPGFLDKPD
jgi:hypothetical protein